jgi:hypothetical protein
VSSPRPAGPADLRDSHSAILTQRTDNLLARTSYGRVYADAIPGARFEPLRETGHLPPLETPYAFDSLIWDFADARSTPHGPEPESPLSTSGTAPNPVA